MANIFERGFEWMAERIAYYIPDVRQRALYGVQNYYEGNQPPQLKVKSGQANDNISLNWLGLAVDRGVSMLVGGGVEFILPEEADDQQEYIDGVWEANKKNLLLHSHATDGALFGTPFMKIVPDGITSPYTDETFPRLVVLDPKLMKIECDPRDKEHVTAYIMEYRTTENGKEKLYREVTRRATPDDYDTPDIEPTTWVIEQWEFVSTWQKISAVEWPYDFPPILHNKNLPSIHSIYGTSDIEQVINPQDKYNFVQSNNLKINRYHAHPKTWGAGFTKTDKTSWGADEMITVSDPSGKIANLEMSSDLSGARSIAEDLKQAIFALARDVDISTLNDKMGQLTNFGLKLLYSDALAKVATKRLLYGEAYLEINRRLLVLKGWEKLDSDPGYIRWGDELPINESEEMEIDRAALDLGIIDKQTVAERWAKRYGMEWDEIQERMTEEKANEQTLGSLLLRNFNRGQ